MKTIIPLLFLSMLITIITNCTRLSNKNSGDVSPKYLSRAPSSVIPRGCFFDLKYLLHKRERGREFRAMILTKDVEGMKNLFWTGHNIENVDGILPDPPAFRRFRRWNQSYYVPALFQTKNKFVGEEDTFSTIIKAVDENQAMDAEEVEAMNDILGWVDKVSTYKSRVDRQLELGMEHERMYIELESRLTGEQRLTAADFPRELDVPIVDDQGNIQRSTITVRRLADLRSQIQDLRRLADLNFANGIVDEAFKKSKLYDIMMDQALYYRRLELVLQRLELTPLAKLSDDQKALKELIEDTLAHQDYKPRLDAMRVVRAKEYRAEFWATLKFWRSKRVEREAKFNLSRKILDQASALSPAAMLMRGTALLTVTSGMVLAPVAILYDDNPTVQYYTSVLGNRFNNFLVFTLGVSSSAMASCYKSTRSWSIEEVDVFGLVEAHLSSYHAYARMHPEYNLQEDEDYQRKRLRLQAICSQLRLEYGRAGEHARTKDILIGSGDGYRFAGHLILGELIEDNHERGSELAPLIYDLFEQRALFEDGTREAEIISEIRSIAGEDFVNELLDYDRNLVRATSLIQNGTMRTQFETPAEFFDYLEALPE